jgi:hypothetical protein
MRFDLGSLGRVRVRFDSHRTKLIKPPRGCTGPKAKKKIGAWKGRIRFRGEHRYTRVRARRAPGSVLYPVAWHCHGHRPAHATHATTLMANGPHHEAVWADKRSRGSKAKVSVSRFENHKGGVYIIRDASVQAPPNAFTYNRHLTRARVKPPKPFSGSARLTPDLEFRGSLEVNLAGMQHVSIAGKNWLGRLSRR